MALNVLRSVAIWQTEGSGIGWKCIPGSRYFPTLKPEIKDKQEDMDLSLIYCYFPQFRASQDFFPGDRRIVKLS